MSNSRPQSKDNQTWRRRICNSCHATVTTIEAVYLEDALRVEKRGGDYEPFYRDKLFVSIYKAIDHLNNPASTASSLTTTVLRHITKHKPLSPVVATADISTVVALVLKRYNAAASVRYLSYQTNLQLPNDVRRTLRR